MIPLLILGAALGLGVGLMETLGETASPAPSHEREVVVRIQAGWSGHESPRNPKYELGGFIPDIIPWDGKGEPIDIGHGRNNKIADGEGEDMFIEMDSAHPGGLHQAEYLTVHANRNDNICISAITIKQPGGAELTLTADIPARICGYHGSYESLTEVKTKMRDYQPHCFWMTGKEDKNNIFPQSIAFHLTDFVGYGNHTAPANGDNDAICAVQPRLWEYDHWPSIFWPPLIYPPIDSQEIHPGLRDTKEWNYLDVNYLQDSKNWRNKSGQRPWEWGAGWWNGRKRRSVDLGVHHDNSAQATEPATPRKKSFYRKGQMHDVILGGSVSASYSCEHPNMMGPDILSHTEKLCCDLDTYTLYPFCEEKANSKGPCFDEQKMELLERSPMRIPNRSCRCLILNWGCPNCPRSLA